MTFCANCGGLWEEPGEFCRKCGASRLPGVVTAANVVRALTCGNTKYWECRDSQQRTQAKYRGRSLVFVRRGKRNRLSSVGALSVADRFVKFYAWQSIFFTMAWIGLTIAWTVFTEIFEAVTGGFLLMLLIPIDCVLTLAGIGYWVFLMYRAYQGKQYKIPLLGKLAEIRANK